MFSILLLSSIGLVAAQTACGCSGKTALPFCKSTETCSKNVCVPKRSDFPDFLSKFNGCGPNSACNGLCDNDKCIKTCDPPVYPVPDPKGQVCGCGAPKGSESCTDGKYCVEGRCSTIYNNNALPAGIADGAALCLRFGGKGCCGRNGNVCQDGQVCTSDGKCVAPAECPAVGPAQKCGCDGKTARKACPLTHTCKDNVCVLKSNNFPPFKGNGCGTSMVCNGQCDNNKCIKTCDPPTYPVPDPKGAVCGCDAPKGQEGCTDGKYCVEGRCSTIYSNTALPAGLADGTALCIRFGGKNCCGRNGGVCQDGQVCSHEGKCIDRAQCKPAEPIKCGCDGKKQLAACPSGMTCQDNVCQVAANPSPFGGKGSQLCGTSACRNACNNNRCIKSCDPPVYPVPDPNGELCGCAADDPTQGCKDGKSCVNGRCSTIYNNSELPAGAADGTPFCYRFGGSCCGKNLNGCVEGKVCGNDGMCVESSECPTVTPAPTQTLPPSDGTCGCVDKTFVGCPEGMTCRNNKCEEMTSKPQLFGAKNAVFCGDQACPNACDNNACIRSCDPPTYPIPDPDGKVCGCAAGAEEVQCENALKCIGGRCTKVDDNSDLPLGVLDGTGICIRTGGKGCCGKNGLICSAEQRCSVDGECVAADKCTDAPPATGTYTTSKQTLEPEDTEAIQTGITAEVPASRAIVSMALTVGALIVVVLM